ncbi:hypothetical protein Patl1_33463 [Pistacia atlantica]|uniref:Uncharacterized protein n=1 Tax=Pistacia atlantica TaxID=434234 RepID=A0ACC0ZQ96_9ROSI|nr:hypothetical protein Patl1_33463 [Pistacia atlantica]
MLSHDRTISSEGNIYHMATRCDKSRNYMYYIDMNMCPVKLNAFFWRLLHRQELGLAMI